MRLRQRLIIFALGLLLAALLGGCAADARAGAADPALGPVESVATGLEVPWDMAFLPDGTALFTERPGRVRLLTVDGRVRPQPVAVIPTAEAFTGGLLGIAVHPDFAHNGFVYLYRTAERDNQVVRYRYAGGALTGETVVLGGIPQGGDHVGGRIRFGEDGWLYVTTGDTRNQDTPQDPNSLGGKLLRLCPEDAVGSGPGRPEIVASGLRNSQGMAWGPDGQLVVTDHGPHSDDELNIVRRGANYGWPTVIGKSTQDGTTAPTVLWPETIAPSGVTYLTVPGSAWTGSYLVGAMVGQQLRRVVLAGDRVVVDEPVLQGQFGRLRAVFEAPDGTLYAFTSNRDGLGSPREGDDRILRFRPPA